MAEYYGVLEIFWIIIIFLHDIGTVVVIFPSVLVGIFVIEHYANMLLVVAFTVLANIIVNGKVSKGIYLVSARGYRGHAIR